MENLTAKLEKMVIKPEPEQKRSKEVARKEEKGTGRPRDFNVKTKKIGITIPEDTYDLIKVAIATSHKELKTQNKFINEAILSFLKNEE